MLHFLIKLPLRVLAFPVWLVVSVINTLGMFFVGLASWIFYLIAGVAVIAALGCVGFQLYMAGSQNAFTMCGCIYPYSQHWDVDNNWNKAAPMWITFFHI